MWEAASDLVKAEEEDVGEWRVDGGAGDGGGPLDGVWVLPEETEEGVGDKQDRAEVKPAGDGGVGEEAGIILKGDEQEVAATEEANLRGEGEQQTRLGLKTEETGLDVLTDHPETGSSGLLCSDVLLLVVQGTAEARWTSSSRSELLGSEHGLVGTSSCRSWSASAVVVLFVGSTLTDSEGRTKGSPDDPPGSAELDGPTVSCHPGDRTGPVSSLAHFSLWYGSPVIPGGDGWEVLDQDGVWISPPPSAPSWSRPTSSRWGPSESGFWMDASF